MTPKEKANELYEIYTLETGNETFAIKCALIMVDEIIKLRKGYFDCTNPMQDEKYWQEVKQEIKNI